MSSSHTFLGSPRKGPFDGFALREDHVPSYAAPLGPLFADEIGLHSDSMYLV
jgi:hypothetical protein